jgi:hypothetical protein
VRHERVIFPSATAAADEYRNYDKAMAALREAARQLEGADPAAIAALAAAGAPPPPLQGGSREAHLAALQRE